MSNWIDKAIGYINPEAGVRRAVARLRMQIAAEYAGATRGRRAAGWTTTQTSANAEIGKAGALLRDRSRDLVRNNPFAKRAMREWSAKVVGAGITPRSTPAAMRVWDAWQKQASADGLPNFAALLRMAVEAKFESGEVYLRRRVRRANEYPIPLQVQVLEADFCDWSRTTNTAGGYTIQGVEFDLRGRRNGYYMFGQHPGEALVTNLRGGLGAIESRLIPAEDVIHFYDQVRPGQVHGIPALSAVMATMRDLDDWEDAELVRKKTEACLAAFIESPEGNIALGAQTADANGVVAESFEPGMITRLKPGETVTVNQPQHAGGYEEYKRSRVRDVATGVCIPYEILRGDLSQVNYSSYRSGLLSFRDAIEQEQWLSLIPIVCEQVWAWVMEAAHLAGELPGSAVPAVTWAPPAFDLLDRGEEAKADELELRLGTTSWPQAISRRGEDPEAQINEIETWRERLEKAGVKFSKENIPNAGNGTEQQPPTR